MEDADGLDFVSNCCSASSSVGIFAVSPVPVKGFFYRARYATVSITDRRCSRNVKNWQEMRKESKLNASMNFCVTYRPWNLLVRLRRVSYNEYNDWCHATGVSCIMLNAAFDRPLGCKSRCTILAGTMYFPREYTTIQSCPSRYTPRPSRVTTP